MKAKFYMGPKDGAEEDVQTSNGFAPDLYQYPALPVDLKKIRKPEDLVGVKGTIYYYDLQEVKEGIAYYKYRCTA
jgi:hypothetical protein